MKESFRDKLNFIDGLAELNDKEVYALYENLKPILGSNLEDKGAGTYIARKKKDAFDEAKMRMFCCGCQEFKIKSDNSEFYFAYDYGI